MPRPGGTKVRVSHPDGGSNVPPGTNRRVSPSHSEFAIRATSPWEKEVCLRMLSDCMAPSRDLTDTWRTVLGRLEIELLEANYDTWLRGTTPLRLEAGTLIVEARRSIGLEWLNERLSIVVRRALHAVTGQNLDVYFVPPGERQPGLDAHLPPEPEAPRRGHVIGSINGTQTFERYIEAAGNRVAHRSALALAEGSDEASNPLYIHGAPGMGKSHLLHALAGRAAATGRSVACFSAEAFTTRYLTAMRANTLDLFQDSVRGVSLFVIDDVQYLAGKKGTLEELRYTVDAVLNAGGQVAFGSEVTPAELGFPEPLASRLAQGLVVRVAPFKRDERRRFVEWLCQDRRAAFPGWAIERIAALELSSVRLLQGAVNAAIAQARYGQLDPADLDGALGHLALGDAAPRCSAGELLDAVARHFHLTGKDLAGRKRTGPLTEARSAAVALLHHHGLSYADIATMLGGRDRSTVRELAARGEVVITAEPALRALSA